MKHFVIEHETIIGEDVTITSWWDTGDRVWHALSPRYVGTAYDWRGVVGQSRQEAIDNLIAFLARHLEEQPSSSEL